MLQDPNVPAWLHALPGRFDFPLSFSFSIHRRPVGNAFVPPGLSP
ncbi:hypothetical protein [Ramlibacter ginsenosidimutans]|nr:hypothetical protein [Ramlibacter ginsenosidimutans]